jgi:hypothetical protein
MLQAGTSREQIASALRAASGQRLLSEQTFMRRLEELLDLSIRADHERIAVVRTLQNVPPSSQLDREHGQLRPLAQEGQRPLRLKAAVARRTEGSSAGVGAGSRDPVATGTPCNCSLEDRQAR